MATATCRNLQQLLRQRQHSGDIDFGNCKPTSAAFTVYLHQNGVSVSTAYIVSPSYQSSTTATVLHTYSAEQLPASHHQRQRSAISNSGHSASAAAHLLQLLRLVACDLHLRGSHQFQRLRAAIQLQQRLCSNNGLFFSFSFFGFNVGWQHPYSCGHSSSFLRSRSHAGCQCSAAAVSCFILVLERSVSIVALVRSGALSCSGALVLAVAVFRISATTTTARTQLQPLGPNEQQRQQRDIMTKTAQHG
jgi:hypothetical protein